jgi:hypothetical protein
MVPSCVPAARQAFRLHGRGLGIVASKGENGIWVFPGESPKEVEVEVGDAWLDVRV